MLKLLVQTLLSEFVVVRLSFSLPLYLHKHLIKSQDKAFLIGSFYGTLTK